MNNYLQYTDNSRIQAIYKGPFDLWLNVDKLIWRGGKSFHSLDPSLRDGIKDTSLRNASRHIKATKLVCCLMLVCVCISPYGSMTGTTESRGTILRPLKLKVFSKPGVWQRVKLIL